MTADQTLQDVSSRFGIQHALSLYCRGIDRLDAQLIAAAYWPDAAEDHGIFKGTARDFAPWIVKFLNETYVATQHILGQSCIEMRGDRAAGETYVSSLHNCRKGNGRIFEAVNGRYVDRFERRNGAWKISSRVVVLDFLREFEAPPAEVQGIPGLTFGTRGPADLSFSVFDSR
jgi:SnoaL-like domain